MTKKQKIDALEKTKVFVQSEEFGNGPDGLCIVVLRLYHTDKSITKLQLKYLESLIEKDENKYTNRWGLYYWEPGSRAPRIRWINNKLKELTK